MVRNIVHDDDEKASPSYQNLDDDVVGSLRQLRVMAESGDDSDGLRVSCVCSLPACSHNVREGGALRRGRARRCCSSI